MSKKTFLVLNLSMCLLLGGCSTRTFKEHEALCDTTRRDNSGFLDSRGYPVEDTYKEHNALCDMNRKDNSEFLESRGYTVDDSDLDGVPDGRDLCPNSPSSVCSGSGLNEIEQEWQRRMGKGQP